MSNDAKLKGLSGREASMARRKALSQGKGSLPAATERVRSGFREAAMPTDVPTTAPAPVSVPAAPVSAPASPVAPTPSGFGSGREASMARRSALSKGKGSLPPATERVRSGFREGAMPTDVPSAANLSSGATKPAGFGSGRDASMARRKALSQGKGSLPPAKERVRSGFREGAMPTDVPSHPDLSSAASTVEAVQQEAVVPGCSGREASRKHRMIRAQYGRGNAAPVAPTRTQRQGELSYPTKVPAITTAVSNATVTGLSYASGRAMTGAEAGFDKPLTGTQYVASNEGAYRASSGKVGHARTHGGQTVSGTMVRSTVKITGDEDSSEIKITGDADQTLGDDLNAASEVFVPVAAQFQRQSQPHGQSVHGTNLGRSARSIGSRSRDTERPVEQTDGGHAVSGTAIGRSVRVTGDEQGSLRQLTGSQYLAPAGAQNTQAPETGRADPATGGKVTQSQTWGGQTITGPQMEHDGLVTGSEPGSCATMTGTPYYGATAAHGWCDTDAADNERARRAQRTPRAVTGDVPLHDPMVSGTDRGADRTITGSTYFVAEETAGLDREGDMVTQSINGFSVSSPQRASHLQARAAAPADAGDDRTGITGTFAQGEGKITGNVEFAAVPRSGRGGLGPAHFAVTGEGAVKGSKITGSAWSDDDRVTGTEGYIADGRNPSERAGTSHGFAGAGRFKSKAPNRDQSSAVTGAVGWTPKSGAAVTLSGGAAG